ncbi:MAG: acetylglutamate kinase, partial [Oscillospiraceae bacterium]|nr:acetylglutamate kinase [Oscillospiraceae bacterium]
IGLCGLDDGLLQAKQLSSELGYVGELTGGNSGVIFDALDKGFIPVVATVASGENGEVFNINADIAASRIAVVTQAANLILMTDVKGILENKDDESTLIHTIHASEVQLLKSQGIISGGMLPKVDCCFEAVRGGVAKANIIDGRIPHSILLELLTDQGAGTMIIK